MLSTKCPSAPKSRKTMGLNWSRQDDSSDDSDFSDDDSYSGETRSRRNSTQHQQESNESSDNNICLDSATDTVDAALSTASMPINLNLDQVITIEEKLDLYEKISLGYLLYDDPEVALQKLLKLLDGGNDKIVYNWAITQNLAGVKWAEKLVEALCIIQNYQVVSQLGYNRRDLDVRFLPHHDFTFVYVNKIRKALYFLCEDFVQSDVQQLLELARQDAAKKNFMFKITNSQYLELNLLHWECIGYIRQDDLSNLCSVLKQMDQLDLCERLKTLVPVVEQTSSRRIERSFSKTVDNVNVSTKKPKAVFENILNPRMGLSEFSSFDSPISADNAVHVSADNKYYIDPKNPGICLIINQENFYREIDSNLQHLLPQSENKLESRLGTARDKEKLEETFKKFGFKTIVEDNLTHSEIIEKIQTVILSIRNESSIFICIMSHGDQGIVYGVNSCRVKVDTIKKIMCSKNRENLSGKPKILILQSCQGNICQTVSNDDDDDDITMDGPSSPLGESVPPRADMYTFWATVPGYGAIRNKKTGSWFIQSLCEKMIELGNENHFDDICTLVNGVVSSKRWKQANSEVAMVPIKDSTLRKLLYLPPIKQ